MDGRYQGVRNIFQTDCYYLDCIRKTIAAFPPLDCPDEYKEAICGLSGGENLADYINEPLESLKGRTILQVLQARDFEAIEQYIFECVSLDIAGPGAY